MKRYPRRLARRVRSMHVVVASLLAWVALPRATGAQTDHFNLEEGLPASVEDAYPTAFRNREFQIGPRYERTAEGDDQILLNPRLEAGPLRNAQLGITVPVLLGSADQTGSGDITVDALYNFNTEGLTLPAFSLAGRAEFPTGEARAGVDAEFKLLVTRSITNRLDRIHLNLVYLRAGAPDATERRDRYAAILGYSGRLGPDMILVADVLREQELEKGLETNIVELGLRRQITPLFVLSLGAGVGIGAESPDFRITVGLQRTLTFFYF